MRFVWVFFAFLFIYITPSFANSKTLILQGDIDSLSLDSAQDLTNSLMEIMESFADENQLTKIKKQLTRSDNLTFNPSSLQEFNSALPLPSETIVRVSKDIFKSEQLYLENQFVIKQQVIYSYGQVVSIEFELSEIKPIDLVTKDILGLEFQIPKEIVPLDPKILAAAGVLSFPALISIFNKTSTDPAASNLQPASYYETTEYDANFGLGNINASSAYSRGYTGSGVTVSVMDTTFDTDHPDLVDVFVTGYNALDQTTNVHCEDNTSMNGGSNSGCTSLGSHGSHVAGTIAANKDEVGFHGVAYNAKIKPVVIMNGAGSSAGLSNAETAAGIDAATGSGIAAMNNSWGASTTASYNNGSSTVYYALPYAHASTSLASVETTAWETAVQNTVIVFANGNEGMNTATGRVATYDTAANAAAGGNTGFQGYVTNSAAMNVIRAGLRGSQSIVNSNLEGKWLTVVSLNSSNVISTYSNGCGDAKAYCISAPGESIYSTIDTVEGNGNYGTKSGTSMAAPHVTGAIAVLKQQFPNLTPAQMVTLLIDSATDLGTAGVDTTYGVGMLNLAEASLPSGSSFIAALNANIANGGTLGAPTTSNTSLNFSSLFSSSLSNQDLTIGILDKFDRSFEWDPTISFNNTSKFSFDNFVKLLNENKQFDLKNTDTTKIYFVNKPNLQNINIDHKINKFSINFNATDDYNDFSSIETSNNFLRYHKVDPTNKNVFSLSTNYKINNSFDLGTTFGKGKLVNDNSFNESSINLNYNHKLHNINFGLGNLFENGQFMGSKVDGAYSLNKPTKSNFISLGSSFKLHEKFLLHAGYTKFNTKVDMAYNNFAKISNLSSDEYIAGITMPNLFNNKDKLKVSYILPLASTGGDLIHSTTKGYNANGSYRSVIENHSLKNNSRENDINIMYNYNINSNFKILSMANYSLNNLGIENNNGFKLYQGLSLSF